MDSLEERMNKNETRYLAMKVNLEAKADNEWVSTLEQKTHMLEVVTQGHESRIEKLEQHANIKQPH